MLSCKEVAAQASDFKDKNLSWHRALSFKLHLLMCGHCQRFIRQFVTSITVSSKIGLQRASEGEVKDIIGLISSHKADSST